MTWAVVRGWLQDLAQEIAAADEAGTRLPLAFERVWVSDRRARLVDWMPDGVAGAGERPESINSLDVPRVQRFLYGVAKLGLRIGEPGLHRVRAVQRKPWPAGSNRPDFTGHPLIVWQPPFTLPLSLQASECRTERGSEARREFDESTDYTGSHLR